jgi:hypothetical protein
MNSVFFLLLQLNNFIKLENSANLPFQTDFWICKTDPQVYVYLNPEYVEFNCYYNIWRLYPWSPYPSKTYELHASGPAKPSYLPTVEPKVIVKIDSTQKLHEWLTPVFQSMRCLDRTKFFNLENNSTLLDLIKQFDFEVYENQPEEENHHEGIVSDF